MTNPGTFPGNCVPWDVCRDRCTQECTPNLINAFIHNNVSLLAYAVAVLILYAICLSNFDDVLKKIRSFPSSAYYPARGLKTFLNLMFLLGLLLILVYILLLKFNIR